MLEIWIPRVNRRPLTCWDCRFESRPGHECLCVVSVVCYQLEVSATSWSLVQRSPTDCVWSRNLVNEETMACVGPRRQKKNNVETQTAYDLTSWNRSVKSNATFLLTVTASLNIKSHFVFSHMEILIFVCEQHNDHRWQYSAALIQKVSSIYFWRREASTCFVWVWPEYGLVAT